MWSRTKMKRYQRTWRSEHRDEINRHNKIYRRKRKEIIAVYSKRNLAFKCSICNSKCDGTNSLIREIICSKCFDDYLNFAFTILPKIELKKEFTSFNSAAKQFKELRRNHEEEN
jgi:hypothetical protein